MSPELVESAIVARRLLVPLGEFGREAVAALARRDRVSDEHLVQDAVTQLRDDASVRAVPAFAASAPDPPTGLELELELEASQWRRLEVDALRQDLTLEALVRHEVLAYLARREAA